MEYAGLPKEERDRVFRLYSDQARSFRRSLNILLISSVIVFALFVVPFLGFSAQLSTARDNAARVEQERLETEEMLARLEPKVASMKGINKSVNLHNQRTVAISVYKAWADEGRDRTPFILAKRAEYRDHKDDDLRDWANGVQSTLSTDVFRRVRYVNMGVSDQCEWRLDEDRESLTDYVACRACSEFRDLDDLVVRQFRGMSVDWSAEASTPSDLTAIVDRACGFLLQGEVHWRGKKPLPPDYNRMRGYLSHDARAYRETVQVIQTQLRGHIARNSEESARLIAELDLARSVEAGLQSELAQLSKFDRLATPFGDVPITLNQLALLFPVAVAIGFLAVATSFGQMTGLHLEFGRLSRRFDADGQVISQSYLNTVAPVWLTATDGPAVRALKWGVLLVPLALILMTYALIQQSGTLADRFPEGSAISSVAYYVLYAMTLALVLGGLFHIWLSAKRVRVENQ